MDVQARGEVEVVAVMMLEPLRELRGARISRPVDFRAIAGRQDHHLGDALFLFQRAQCRDQPVLVECDLFAQRNRRGLVVETENVKCHENALCFVTLRFWVRNTLRSSGNQGQEPHSFGYSAGVFSKSSLTIDSKMCAWPVKAGLALALPVLAACVGPRVAPPEPGQVFYTVTGEIALERGEARTAALQYTAAAKSGTDSKLWRARAKSRANACSRP